MSQKATVASGLLLVAISLPVRADVAITGSFVGYDAFFKSCVMDFEMSGDPAPNSLTYFLDIGTKGRALCRYSADDHSCNKAITPTARMDFTCKDVRGIELVKATCRNDEGTRIPCGKIDAKADESIPVPFTTATAAGTMMHPVGTDVVIDALTR